MLKFKDEKCVVVSIFQIFIGQQKFELIKIIVWFSTMFYILCLLIVLVWVLMLIRALAKYSKNLSTRYDWESKLWNKIFFLDVCKPVYSGKKTDLVQKTKDFNIFIKKQRFQIGFALFESLIHCRYFITKSFFFLSLQKCFNYPGLPKK